MDRNCHKAGGMIDFLPESPRKSIARGRATGSNSGMMVPRVIAGAIALARARAKNQACFGGAR